MKVKIPFVVSKSNQETLEFYAGDNIVAIYDNDTDELLATLLHEEGIDTPLSISRYDKPTLSTWEMEKLDPDERYLYEQSLIHTCYYHRDHQNSIIALTNKEGQIIESYSYDAFGNITQHSKTLETYNPYGYTGRETDTDDLYYYRARYYDPTIGRFITPDPIGFAGGDTNFYRYVGNDPVNFVDPSGLSALLTSFLDQNNPLKDLVEWWDTTPDTSVSKTVAPNSIIPQGKTNTQTNKPKTAQTTSKTAQTNKGDGVKIKGNVPKVEVVKEKECKEKAPWMNVAEREYNQWKNHHESQRAVEVQHDKNKYSEGVINDNYHKLAGVGKMSMDPTPWCASFVSYCLIDAGYKITPSASSQFPVNNPKFVKIAKPIYGAIVVLRYKNGTGHTGFIYGKTKNGDHALLGGNQSDTITLNPLNYYVKKAKADIIGYYVPKEYEKCAKQIISQGDNLKLLGNIAEFKNEAGDKTGVSSKTR